MKNFISLLIAFIALPTAVNAESYWLILTYGEKGNYGAVEKIEMEMLLNVKAKVGNGRIVQHRVSKVGYADFIVLWVNKLNDYLLLKSCYFYLKSLLADF